MAQIKPSLKTDTLNLRIAPATKEALRMIGEMERRNMVNTLEWLIAEYFRTKGLSFPGTKKGRR